MIKKRLLILTGIFPPDIGGPTAFLDPLARELVRNGYQVRVLTFGQKNKEKHPYRIKRISKAWPGFLRSFIYLKWGFWYGLKTDILYSQDLYTAGLTGLIIKKLLKKPLVIRFVGDSAWEKASSKRLVKDDIMAFQEKKYSWRIEFYKKIRKKILIGSDKVIAASYFLKDLSLKIGLPKEKIKVIYNSVDFLKIKALEPNYGGSTSIVGSDPHGGRTLVTIARLVPWKGVDMLIEIMPDLIKKYGQINLVVVGQGPELENLKQLTQNLGLKDYVYFAGQANRQEVNDYLAAADLFVLNTNYDGMSHLLLEAMKIGAPIITTFAGGNPETIKDKETGLLVDYNNKKEWLEAINYLLDNPEKRKELAAKAKDDLKKFNWDNLVKETVNIFKNF